MFKTYQQSIFKSIRLKEFSLTLLSFCLVAVSGTKAVEAATLTVVANNLDNPRGLIFGPDGALYVAEAGKGGEGPSIRGPDLVGNLVYGPTGAVTRIQNGVQERIISGLPSLLILSGEQPAENGQSLGPHDIGFSQSGNTLYVATGYGSTLNFKDDLGSAGADLGKLLAFDLDASGAWQRRADFGPDFVTYEGLNNPDGESLITNPYALQVTGDNVFVVDAGANDLFRVDQAGNLSLQTVFPKLNFENMQIQSVPTSITLGPDGAYYIGEFTGFPFPEGKARIFRYVLGGEPEVYADGFTQISDLAFDSQGNLNVLEYSVKSISSPSDLAGALIQISRDGIRRNLVNPGDGLVAPSQLAFGSDGAIYISNYGSFAEQGQIVRVEDTTSVPEPSSALGVLTFALGIGSLRKYKRKQLADEVTTGQKLC